MKRIIRQVVTIITVERWLVEEDSPPSTQDALPAPAERPVDPTDDPSTGRRRRLLKARVIQFRQSKPKPEKGES
jgi:hypothetical protein